MSFLSTKSNLISHFSSSLSVICTFSISRYHPLQPLVSRSYVFSDGYGLGGRSNIKILITKIFPNFLLWHNKNPDLLSRKNILHDPTGHYKKRTFVIRSGLTFSDRTHTTETHHFTSNDEDWFITLDPIDYWRHPMTGNVIIEQFRDPHKKLLHFGSLDNQWNGCYTTFGPKSLQECIYWCETHGVEYYLVPKSPKRIIAKSYTHNFRWRGPPPEDEQQSLLSTSSS